MDKTYTYKATLDEMKTNVEDWEGKEDIWDAPKDEKSNTSRVTNKKPKKTKKAKAKKTNIINTRNR